MVKYTQIIRRQIADELFVLPFYRAASKGLNHSNVFQSNLKAGYKSMIKANFS